MPPQQQPVLSDPALEACPDYSLDEHQDTRNTLAAVLQNSQALAIDALKALWKKENDRNKEIWAQQGNAAPPNQQNQPNQPGQPAQPDNPGQPNPPAQQNPPDPVLPPANQPQANAEKKKRPVIRKDLAMPLNDYPRPSTYALQKLEALEYVELWYFSTEGCSDASYASISAADETLGLVQADDGMTLKRVARGSKKVIPDERLSSHQLSVAKGNYLYQAQHVAQWPEDVMRSFSTFYFNLDNHPFKGEILGPESLIHYQAQVRREWFDLYKRSTTGEIFDIASINTTRLLSINARLTRDAAHSERIAMERERRYLPRQSSGPHLSSHEFSTPRKRRRSPSPDVTPSRKVSKQSFLASPAHSDKPKSACVICLSRIQHDVRSCQSTTIWDGSQAFARRTSNNNIVDCNDTPLCLDWNRRRPCKGFHKSKHICSGCGATDHCAQDCPRAEKASSANAIKA